MIFLWARMLTSQVSVVNVIIDSGIVARPRLIGEKKSIEKIEKNRTTNAESPTLST